jgi:hypothetical protein
MRGELLKNVSVITGGLNEVINQGPTGQLYLLRGQIISYICAQQNGDNSRDNIDKYKQPKNSFVCTSFVNCARDSHAILSPASYDQPEGSLGWTPPAGNGY